MLKKVVIQSIKPNLWKVMVGLLYTTVGITLILLVNVNIMRVNIIRMGFLPEAFLYPNYEIPIRAVIAGFILVFGEKNTYIFAESLYSVLLKLFNVDIFPLVFFVLVSLVSVYFYLSIIQLVVLLVKNFFKNRVVKTL